MSALLNLGDKITAGNKADATFFYKKRVLADSGTLLTEAETDANNRELLAQKLFDKASIVYTAGGVKAGTNYSVKGTDFTVTRAGVKNVVNRAGVLTEIPANTPATEFSNGVLKGTLIEPSATNLLQRSEEFDNAYWTKTRLNTTGTPPWINVAVAPDGTTTAEKLIANTENLDHWVLRTNTVTASATYTFSVYAKKAEYNFVILRTSTPGRDVVFNLNTGAIGSSSGTGTASIESVGNGWYRCISTITTDSTTLNCLIKVTNADNVDGNFVGDNESGIFIWGAQLETGSVATSYIKTVSTTITQPADVITATGVSGLIGQTQGFLACEFEFREISQSGAIISLSEAASEAVVNNVNGIRIFRGLANVITINIGNGILIDNKSGALVSSGVVKVLLTYSSTLIQVFVNGSLYLSYEPPVLPTSMDALSVGSRVVVNNRGAYLNDTISQFLIGKTAISDAEAIAWSTL
jgi:hypothetical protein